jgi:predicted subunit of tRNA(5-methylaminomethyl-2-thiouridylate) methyltransferase
MNVLIPGHTYEVSNFEKKESTQLIQFIHKEASETFPHEIKTLSDGTTNEELIAVLIDRLYFLNSKFPCKENACCITHLEEALMWLEKRTSDRIKRNVEGKLVK